MKRGMRSLLFLILLRQAAASTVSYNTLHSIDDHVNAILPFVSKIEGEVDRLVFDVERIMSTFSPPPHPPPSPPWPPTPPPLPPRPPPPPLPPNLLFTSPVVSESSEVLLSIVFAFLFMFVVCLRCLSERDAARRVHWMA